MVSTDYLSLSLGSVQVESIEANFLLSLGATYRKVGELIDGPLLKVFFKLGFSFYLLVLDVSLGLSATSPCG